MLLQACRVYVIDISQSIHQEILAPDLLPKNTKNVQTFGESCYLGTGTYTGVVSL